MAYVPATWQKKFKEELKMQGFLSFWQRSASLEGGGTLCCKEQPQSGKQLLTVAWSLLATLFLLITLSTAAEGQTDVSGQITLTHGIQVVNR